MELIITQVEKTYHLPKNITESDLRYYFFLGSFFIRSDKNSICAEWEWIPLLDFVYCLTYVALELKNRTSDEAFVDFTENDEKLFLSRTDDSLTIRASFSDEMIEVPLSVFVKEVSRVSGEYLDGLAAQYPNLSRNSFFRKTLNLTKLLV